MDRIIQDLLQALGQTDPGNRRRRPFLPPTASLHAILLFISTILFAVGHQQLHAQDVTTEAPPPSAAQTPQMPDLSGIPHATPLPPASAPQRAVLESDTQSKHDTVYTAHGDVMLTYGDHILTADDVTYDEATGDVVATGHVHLTGGENNESIDATHGTYNLGTQAGRFYDVNGSVGLVRPQPVVPSPAATNTSGFGAASPRLPGFQTDNPFLFEGRIVLKTGPRNYTILNGSVTSCLLPHPDWQLLARKITLDSGIARASNSVFKLIGIPLLFLPYVTHPVNSNTRQTGLLIPVFGISSASNNTGSKGVTIGEQIYITLGRTADLTVGTLYYSLRGFSENATLRYRGIGDNFFTGHVNALQDRGFYAPVTISKIVRGVPTTTVENLLTNQSGQDATIAFRRQFSPHVRAVGDGEYLSSYIYREAFTENFNQAVSSDIDSVLYLTDQKNGYSFDGRVDRYQGLKVVAVNNNPGQEVKIFHAPSIDFNAVEHRIPGTPLLWSLNSSIAGLKRVQPNFTSSGIIERLDLRPELALPLAFAGIHTLSSIAVEETFYSRSRKAPYGNGATPVELTTPVNRSSFEVNVDIRPPVLERTFVVPQKLQWLLGSQVRHTIEPDITYRSVHGVDNFLSILRFDDIDLASDTDELQYSLTQHLYFRPRPKKLRPLKPGCPATPTLTAGMALPNAPAVDEPGAAEPETIDPEQQPSNDANGIPNPSARAPDLPTRTHVRHADPCAAPRTPPAQQEWFSWQLSQKHFFAQNFGGAVINARRNIFDTTLAFSGIAFLTEARSISPLKSRMRFRTSSHADVEWDFDYDTGAAKFTSSNIFLDLHEKKAFGGFSYALLNAPGRFNSEQIISNTVTGVTGTATSYFSQLRFLAGYGSPTQRGLSAAGGAGLDLNAGAPHDPGGLAQYITVQSSYNWNCCGVSLEYRQYNLGPIRDEGAYRFNFTLANIGTAGNLRRAESLF